VSVPYRSFCKLTLPQASIGVPGCRAVSEGNRWLVVLTPTGEHALTALGTGPLKW